MTGMSLAAANEVHPTAVIAPDVVLGEGSRIGPFAVLEAGVRLGRGNLLGAHCVLKTGTRLGNENHIHEHAVLGGTPQDFKFTGQESLLTVGDRNVFREGVTVHRGSREQASTVIGNDNFLMAYAHVAHDCVLADRIVMANNAALAGEVQIEDQAFLSYGVGVHQFARIGKLAMIGGKTKVTQDVLPFFITDGNPARVRGLNQVGLKRAGLAPQDISALKCAFRTLLTSGLSLAEALLELRRSDSPHVSHLVAFLDGSERGFHRK